MRAYNLAFYDFIEFLKDVNNAGLGGSQRQNTRLIRYFRTKRRIDLAKTEAGPGGAGEAQLPPQLPSN